MAAVGMVLAVRRRLVLLVSDEIPADKLSVTFRNEIEQLSSQLGDIERCLLKHNNNGDFEKQVIQLAYDLEDAAECSYLLQQHPDDEEQPQSSSGIRFMRRGRRTRAISSRATNSSHDGFKPFKERMDKLCNDCGRNNVGESQSVIDLFSDEQQYPVPEKIVGMDDPLSPLLNDSANAYPSAANSIWICGMGGIGKTTLAREIFNSSPVLMNFQGRAWVHVGLKFQARDIATGILLQLASSESSEEEIQAVETTELMERLHKAQFHRRCLVVLDDVRSVQDWETIRFAFASELGTRIVITTRCSPDEAGMARGYVHEMKLLNDEKCWELFENHLSVLDLVAIGEQPNDVRECIMKKVTSWSGGLPLALTILGGMARGKIMDWMEKMEALPIVGEGNFDKLLETQDFEKLLEIVGMDDPSAANSIWICGMGGIGKTTLAREIFNSSPVLKNFQHRAWVHVGPKFQAGDIKLQLIKSSKSSENAEKEIPVHRRCLVVLDDVRSVQDWETIRLAVAFEIGTRIVITTRCSPDEAGLAKGYVHEMKVLNDNDCWGLFKNHLSECDLVAIGELPNDMRECMMKTVISWSGGLPLALTVLGGMASRNILNGMARGNILDCPDKLEALPVVGKGNFEKLLEILDFIKLLEILALSYTYLPIQLKTCFLYLGHFLNDEVIPVQKLWLMWMAEGLVSAGNRTSIDTAARYLDALVQRRLVMVQKEDFAGVIKVQSCELHDWIYKICKSEGEKEGFARIVDLEKGQKLSSNRRLTIDLDDHGSSTVPEPKHVRSLLIKGDGFSGESSAGLELLGWPGEIADMKEFQRARVLDFDRVDFRSRRLPKGVEKLVYLRYLSFRGCHLEELPSSFTRFPFLETLDLLVRTSCKMIIPNILWKMSCLLHLYFPVSFQSDTGDKLKLDGLTRLETLENFHAGLCDADDLQLLTNLQNFKGIADSNNEDVKKMINFVEGNPNLRSSSLSIRNFDSYSTARIKIVTELLSCNGVHALDIDGHMGELEDHVKSGSSQDPPGSGLHFNEMIFNASEFNKDPMPILGQSRGLRSLVLCNDAFLGNKLEFAESSFPVLKCLKLSNLWFLEELNVEPGAMSSLSSLTIEQCGKLKELPGDLMENTNLEEVKVRQMTKEFLQHVIEMAEEQQASGGKVVVRHFL